MAGTVAGAERRNGSRLAVHCSELQRLQADGQGTRPSSRGPWSSGRQGGALQAAAMSFGRPDDQLDRWVHSAGAALHPEALPAERAAVHRARGCRLRGALSGGPVRGDG